MLEEEKEKCLAIGKLVEVEFASLFESTYHSTDSEDMFEHWDVAVIYFMGTPQQVTKKFEVKGIKNVSRFDESKNENIQWIELMVNGRAGWLFGEADYFAFEQIDSFIIVTKDALQKLILDKVKDLRIVHTPELYRFYCRHNANEKTVLIKTSDLIDVKNCIIPKKKACK
jgi:hypothetical protein